MESATDKGNKIRCRRAGIVDAFAVSQVHSGSCVLPLTAMNYEKDAANIITALLNCGIKITVYLPNQGFLVINGGQECNNYPRSNGTPIITSTGRKDAHKLDETVEKHPSGYDGSEDKTVVIWSIGSSHRAMEKARLLFIQAADMAPMQVFSRPDIWRKVMGGASLITSDVIHSYEIGQAACAEVHSGIKFNTVWVASTSVLMDAHELGGMGLIHDSYSLGGQICMMVGEGGSGIGELIILDSGATHHYTGNLALLSNRTPLQDGARRVRVADGRELAITARGSVVGEHINLNHVSYVPGLNKTVVSVSQLAELDYLVALNKTRFIVKDDRNHGEVAGHGRCVSGLYVVDYLKVPLDRAPATPSSN